WRRIGSFDTLRGGLDVCHARRGVEAVGTLIRRAGNRVELAVLGEQTGQRAVQARAVAELEARAAVAGLQDLKVEIVLVGAGRAAAGTRIVPGTTAGVVAGEVDRGQRQALNRLGHRGATGQAV